MNKLNIPRVLFAGTHSGSGKTTVVCAVLQALVGFGVNAVSFKCGPDYIDPMFHTAVIGTKSRNLDTFFYSHSVLQNLLCKNAQGAEIAIIEGVMGYYDGVGEDGMQHSSYEIACAANAPVVLVVDGKGASTSILATIKGFVELVPNSRICAVLLNRVSGAVYAKLKPMIESSLPGISVIGYLPTLPTELVLKSRHLGLVTPAELDGLRELMGKLAEMLLQTVDFNKIIQIANAALPLEYEEAPKSGHNQPVRIAVARDKAFCFYYEDNLDLLRELGAEIVETSPLADKALPANTDGIIIGGGYPELYANELSANSEYLTALKAALESHLPCIAECGGFMYLNRSIESRMMTGFLLGECSRMPMLSRLGYIELSANEDNMLAMRSENLRGHEYHYCDCTENGNSFTAKKTNGDKSFCVVANENLYAGFPHIHFYSNTTAAQRFIERCREFAKQRGQLL